MTTHDEISKVVFKSGLWKSGRTSKYGFLLSPEVYRVSAIQRNQLENLGSAIRNCLAGLGRLAAISNDQRIAHGNTWGMINRILQTDVPSAYNKIQYLRPSQIPAICKVDLMEGIDGKYYIAEIDGCNKHGMGYSVLARRMSSVTNPKATMFPGVAAILAKEVERRKHDTNVITLLYSNKSRFYRPEFEILRGELKRFGIQLVIVSERELEDCNSHHPVITGAGYYSLFVDLPSFRSNTLNRVFRELYQNGVIDFIIPPKPFLGSKAVLALLRNEENNPTLEAILRSQISLESLKLIRQHIPKTYLIRKLSRKKQSNSDYWRNIARQGNFVLKRVVSSGMKGVVFPGDIDDYETVLTQASNSYYHFVLQEMVESSTKVFNYFSQNGKLVKDNWYMRVTAFFALSQRPNQRIADIVVTARKDKKVHGAVDCLQLGTIITK